MDAWIKMRVDLYRDPKVIAIADHLEEPNSDLACYVSDMCRRDMTVTRNVMRNVTVGALVSVWGVARHRGDRVGDDLLISGVTIGVLDDIADVPGFGDAMESVGWALQTSEGVVLPRFFASHNADPKAANRERQRRFRERKSNAERNGSNVTDNVTCNVTSRPRVEESREEKRREKEEPPPKSPKGDSPRARSTITIDIPPELQSDNFASSWCDWMKHRAEIKKPLTQQQAEKQMAQFAKWGPVRSAAAIEHTIRMGWQGLREPESNGRTSADPRGNFAAAQRFLDRTAGDDE